MPEKRKIDLSIVILSYNTKELLKGCLDSLEKVKHEVRFEVIVPDNNSNDQSVEMVKKYYPEVRVIENNQNLGFAAGNNVAKPFVHGKYILFLNSDTLVHTNTLKGSLEYMEMHKDVGAATCKMILANGEFDKDTRRSFITPWIGLTHLFLKLDRVFPKSKLFGQYWYGYISDNEEHEVDVIEGAYFFVRKEILDKIGWFDEEYFLDGENIDLCWRIKAAGWKIIYYPKVSITHFKGAAKGKVNSEFKKKVSLGKRLKFRMAGVNSMEIFYRKWLWERYPLPLNLFVLTGIKLMKILRITRTVVFG
jgi:hypothetical protein